MDQPNLVFFGRTHPGRVHERNEDAFTILTPDEGGFLLAICDGMGGMGRGDEASRLAVEVLRTTLDDVPPPEVAERLTTAIEAADTEIRAQLFDESQRTQPGATAVLVWIFDGAAHVAWVGDSRAYWIRGDVILGRTRDHKLVEDLVDAGQLSPEEARQSTLAHVVTRALGGRSADEPVVPAARLDRPWALKQGDRILLCSDGLSDLVEDREIPGLLDSDDVEVVTERLVDLANERGGHDNITCILARWQGPDHDEAGAATPVMTKPRHEFPDGDTDPMSHVVDTPTASHRLGFWRAAFANRMWPREWWWPAATLWGLALLTFAVGYLR
ncbi:MAG: protein phosphatase 2C domain-containing protein [Myxococcota bacterium]